MLKPTVMPIIIRQIPFVSSLIPRVNHRQWICINLTGKPGIAAHIESRNLLGINLWVDFGAFETKVSTDIPER